MLFATTVHASPLDSLLGLDRVSLSGPDAYLGFEHPLPAWAWVLVVGAAVGLAGWSYSRLLGSRPARLVLAGLRAVVLLAIAVLLAGPVVVDPAERDEPDVMVVLVDRSASMAIGDMAAPGTPGTPGTPGNGSSTMTRDAALRRALTSQAAVFGGEALGLPSRRVVWLGFGEEARDVPPLVEDAAWDQPDLAPDAPTTRLRTALETALRQGAGRPLSSIVLFSDGRSPEPTGADLVRRIAQRGARVHVVPLGASDPPFDLAVANVEAPEQAFAKDVVPVTVTLDQLGRQGATAARVRLVDAATGRVLDERELEAGALREPVRLTGRNDAAGPARFRVEVEAASAEERELVEGNNRREFVVEMLDRPVRVLYVEGYPRWEYRYLKNMLVREESIDSSVLLLSADREFAQEGDSPITRPPSTPEEIRPYDVVILGDVPPDYFTPEQLQLIRDHVAVNGAGLMWIGGSRHTPAGYASTPLADVLPMREPSGVAPYAAAPTIELEPTPLAAALQVMQLRGPAAGGAQAEPEWPAELPPLRWVQDLGALKPTSEVLANAPGVAGPRGDPLPLIARLRYGAGQSLYVGTDETWRWRFGRGELYFEQFWVQLVRMLGRERVQSGSEGVGGRLTVSQRQVTAGEPVVVELALDETAAAGAALSEVEVTATRGGGGGDVEGRLDTLVLQPVANDEDPAAAAGRRVFRGVWRPAATGELVLRATEPALDALGLSRPIEVLAADDELRQVEPDHARLVQLAGATGGEVVPLGDLARLVPATPNLAEKVAMDVREPLWNSWLSLLLVVGLLTGEWVMRKLLWLI